jgi:hypothetical protein
MQQTANICAICAWRATCQKKFSVSGKDMHCSDYTEDLSLKKKEEQETEGEKEEG